MLIRLGSIPARGRSRSTRQRHVGGRDFAADRKARQLRTQFDLADFDRLAEAGLLRTGLPADRGGLWANLSCRRAASASSTECSAGADPSVAAGSRRCTPRCSGSGSRPDLPTPTAPAGTTARLAIFDTVAAGRRWGTITSEPGSGGDVVAHQGRRPCRARRPSGGSPATSTSAAAPASTSYMLTTALPEARTSPTVLRRHPRTAPWDGSHGHHAARPRGTARHGRDAEPRVARSTAARRRAWRGPADHGHHRRRPAPFFATLFTAVVLGIARDGRRDRTHPARPQGRHPARLRAGRVGAGRAGALARGPGLRGDAARASSRDDRRARCTRAARQAIRRRARRVVPARAWPRHRRRHVLAAVAVRALVRGRARARLPAPAVGPRLRRPLQRQLGPDLSRGKGGGDGPKPRDPS